MSRFLKFYCTKIATFPKDGVGKKSQIKSNFKPLPVHTPIQINRYDISISIYISDIRYINYIPVILHWLG